MLKRFLKPLLLGALMASLGLTVAEIGVGGPGGSNSVGTMPSLSGGSTVTAEPRPSQNLYLRGTREVLLASIFDLQGSAAITLGPSASGSHRITLELRGDLDVTLDSMMIANGALEVGVFAPADEDMVGAFQYGSTLLPPQVVAADEVLDLGIGPWVTAGIPVPPYRVHTMALLAGRAQHEISIVPGTVRISQRH
ncbi:MAG: hypothetical protein O2799_04000 [Planctomycetota bacterium]|nr:hypothetical protein [Planctomycetota bacterium]